VRGEVSGRDGKSRAKSPKPCRFRGNPCKSERPLSGLETPLFSDPISLGRRLAKVNDRLAVWRQESSTSYVIPPYLLAKVNDRLAVWRPENPLHVCHLPIESCKSERPLSGLETSNLS
jgi:hypothetical protein